MKKLFARAAGYVVVPVVRFATKSLRDALRRYTEKRPRSDFEKKMHGHVDAFVETAKGMATDVRDEVERMRNGLYLVPDLVD